MDFVRTRKALEAIIETPSTLDTSGFAYSGRYLTTDALIPITYNLYYIPPQPYTYKDPGYTTNTATLTDTNGINGTWTIQFGGPSTITGATITATSATTGIVTISGGHINITNCTFNNVRLVVEQGASATIQGCNFYDITDGHVITIKGMGTIFTGNTTMTTFATPQAPQAKPSGRQLLQNILDAKPQVTISTFPSTKTMEMPRLNNHYDIAKNIYSINGQEFAGEYMDQHISNSISSYTF